MREECGVFAIFGHEMAATQAKLGSFTLQHRGEESCGISVCNQGQITTRKGMGLVLEVMTQSTINELTGTSAIAHNRYSTQGGSTKENAQPFAATVKQGQFAVAHNGTITNALRLRTECESKGAVFQSTSDTEVILHLVAQSDQSELLDAIVYALTRLEGAFSLVFLTKDSIIAARDPNGFRPLVIGEFDGGFAVASETCAFQHCGGTNIGEILPGELVRIDANGLQKIQYAPKGKASQCVFEHIYFSRPSSRVFGLSVSQTRKQFGRLLAQVSPVDADMVVGVPNSGLYAGLGYAEASGIPFELGITRGQSVSRSFIQPSQELRIDTVNLKLSADCALLEGQRVIVVDDSVVRGYTSQKIVDLIRRAGAKEVHLRVSSPMLLYPCYYGVDIPSREELVANWHSVDEICKLVGADSLAYLPLEKLMQAVGGNGYCNACFSGDYTTNTLINIT